MKSQVKRNHLIAGTANSPRFAYLRFWEVRGVSVLPVDDPLKASIRFRVGALGGVKSALTSTGFIPDSSHAAKIGTLGKR